MIAKSLNNYREEWGKLTKIYVSFPYICCLHGKNLEKFWHENGALLSEYQGYFNIHSNSFSFYYPVNLDNFVVNNRGQLALKSLHDDEIGFQIPILYQIDLLILLAHNLNTNCPEILDGYFAGVSTLFRVVERKYQALISVEYLLNHYAQIESNEGNEEALLGNMKKYYPKAFEDLHHEDTLVLQMEKARDILNREYDALIVECYNSLLGINDKVPYSGIKRTKRWVHCFCMGKELLYGTNKLNKKNSSHRCCSVASTCSTKGRPHYYYAISGKDDEGNCIPEDIRKESALVNQIVRANYGMGNVDRIRLNDKVQYVLEDSRSITYKQYLKYVSLSPGNKNPRMFSCSERKILSALISNTASAEILTVWSSCYMCIRSAANYPNVRFRAIEKKVDNTNKMECDMIAKKIADSVKK